MRIHGLGPNGVADSAERKAPEPVGPAPRADRASSVRMGTGAQRIVSSVSRDEKMSAEKVASVKLAVDSGTYRIDYDKLAERIVDEDVSRVGLGNGGSE